MALKRTYNQALGSDTRIINDNPVANELNNNMNVISEYNNTMGLELFRNESSIQNVSNKRTRYFMGDGTTGGTFSNLNGDNSIFSSLFRLPSLNQVNNINYPQTHQRVGGQIRIPRMIKEYLEGIPGASAYEIGILYSLTNNKQNSGGVTISANYEFSHFGHMGNRLIVEDNILPMVNIATWNYINAKIQFDMLTNNKEKYFDLNASTVFENFSIDGVIKHEENSMGGESFHSGGYSFGDKGYYRRGDGSKVITVIAKGPVKLNNIFGRYAHPGFFAYLIIKKFDAPTTYYLNARDVLNQGTQQAKIMDYKNTYFKPFQIAILTLPDNIVPREYLEYTDENGFKNYGKAIRIGTIQFKPEGIKLNGIQTPKNLYPLTDACEGIEPLEYFTTIIFDSDEGVMNFS